MNPRGTILYENSRNTRSKDFGLHQFVCACVAHRVDVPRWLLAREGIIGVPRRGASNLLVALRKDLESLRSGGRFVVAVFDSDAIHREVGLPANACRTRVLQGLARSIPPVGAEIILLSRNTETLLKAIADNDGDLPPVIRARALDRKGHDARDRTFHRAATWPRVQQDAVLRAVPSAGRVVQRVTRLWKA